MLAEVQYGGRVTDDYDKRLLACFARVIITVLCRFLHYVLNSTSDFINVTPYDIGCFDLQVWFSKKMLDPSFCFYTGYKIPVGKTVQEYMDYIQSLPILDSPQALGLHPNADIT